MKENLGIGSRVRHPEFGEGVIYQLSLHSIHIVFPVKGAVELLRDYDKLEVIEAINTPTEGLVHWNEIERVIKQTIEEYTDISEIVPLGTKWMKGIMTLQPNEKELKPKEIPIEQFFHKIVMLRDRLRVLEQKINSHKGLTDEEKVDIQQYITRCYGSLTTFNVLFREKHHQFVGDSSKD